MLKRLAQKLMMSQAKLGGKIRIEYGELLQQRDCDAVLFFMLPKLGWGGGLNGAVLDMAGPELDRYITEHVLTPKSGEVFMLPAFNAPYKCLFVAILSHWDGGNGFEERDLLNCYRHTIALAQNNGIKSIAIPALGRDKRDFPHIRFARLAVKGILEKLDDRISLIKIMCVDHTMVTTYRTQLAKLAPGQSS